MQAQNNQFTIRNAQATEMMIFVDNAFKEGWNPSSYDAEYYYKADPNGFFVGELNGQIIATISAVSYEKDIGHISYWIVKPEYRHNGYGKKMFTHALNYLEGANIGLDAELALIPFYKKMGFKQYFKTYTFSCIEKDHPPIDPNIVHIKNVPFQKIFDYERQVCRIQRPGFLKEYIDMPESEAIAYYEQGVLKGYGVLKKAFDKYRISPLYADNLQIATKLINKLRCFPNNICPILLNAQQSNEKAIELFEKMGMKVVYQGMKMYTKELPQINYNKIYSILSSDIG